MAAGKNYNEWLVTPELTIPNTQNRNIISFGSYHQDLDNYMTLRVFEGTDTAHAVIVWTANAVNKWDSLIEVNISQFNGKTIHFAWVLQRNVTSIVNNSAWGVDFITVETVINGVDLQPIEFTSPLEHKDVNMYKKGVNIPVSLRVINNGRTDASQSTISYTFEGNTVTENLPSIKSKEEIEFTFQTPINVSNAGSNTISVTVTASNDEVSDNNTATITSFWTSGESSLNFDFETSAALAAGRWGDEGWVVYQEDNATGYRIPTQTQLFTNGCWAVGRAGGTIASAIWGQMLAFTCSDFQDNEKYISADRWMVLPKIHISSSPTYFKWDAASANSVTGAATEDYQIMISTTNNAVSSFKEVHSITLETFVNPNKADNKPATRYIDLSSYAGKDIYIAFRSITGGTSRGMLLVDNIQFLGENVYGTAVKEIKKINTYIYPNPARDVVNVSSENEILSIEVYSALGQKVYENNSIHENEFSIPLQSMISGMYIVKINTTAGSAMEKVNVVR